LVLKAYTGAQTLERARTAQPDVIILDSVLPDRDGLEVCRDLRRDPLLAGTPIVIVSPDHITRQERIEALRAGAWDHLGAPLDAEHLLLKIETFARTKLDADRAREEGLLDPGQACTTSAASRGARRSWPRRPPARAPPSHAWCSHRILRTEARRPSRRRR